VLAYLQQVKLTATGMFGGQRIKVCGWSQKLWNKATQLMVKQQVASTSLAATDELGGCPGY